MTDNISVRVGDASTGSLWNKNSWHWEEKDYNKIAKQMICEALENMKLAAPSGEEISFRSVNPTGFASISVRKGKKVVVFEFSVSMQWSSASAKGTAKIPEFSNDELDPVLRVELESGDEAVKELVRKTGPKSIKSVLAAFIEFLNSAETGEDKLASDKERRAAELETSNRAQLEKGSEKQQIAEAVKAREREAVSNKTFVEASVWNPNSYHWETRNLNNWATSWVKEQLQGVDGMESLCVSGEAENTIRKGKKISVFTLKISGIFKNSNFSVPNFSNEDGDDATPKLTFSDSATLADSDKAELRKALSELVFTPFPIALKEQ